MPNTQFLGAVSQDTALRTEDLSDPQPVGAPQAQDLLWPHRLLLGWCCALCLPREPGHTAGRHRECGVVVDRRSVQPLPCPALPLPAALGQPEDGEGNQQVSSQFQGENMWLKPAPVVLGPPLSPIAGVRGTP